MIIRHRLRHPPHQDRVGCHGTCLERCRCGDGRLGIGERTGIELPGESPGILRDESDEWSASRSRSGTTSQGYAVNGVHMASVYATIANDGIRVAPTVLKDNGRIIGPRARRVIVRRSLPNSA